MFARTANLFSRAGSATALALGLLATTAAAAMAEIIPFDFMFRGTIVSEEQCAERNDTVFVKAHGYGICMRYYYTKAGGEGRRPLLFINGDKRGISPSNSGYGDPSTIKDVDTSKIEKQIERFSRELGQPAIYLARMGIDGSSGHFRDRRTFLELDITNKAIDAIKKRHGITEFDALGQSGGSTLLSVLLAKRNDIRCAAIGSGLLVSRKGEVKVANDRNVPALRMFDPQEYLPHVVRNKTARIMILTDRQDKAVPLKEQQPYVDRLRASGRSVEHYFFTAKDEKHHGATATGLIVLKGCAQGDDESTIRSRINPN